MTDEKVDLRNLQDKFHNLLDQRNHYNDLAREARDARNLLNDARREKAEELEALKTKRDELNAKAKVHREQRNAYQDQAKALIGERKGQQGSLERSVHLQVRKLRGEIESMQSRQETTVLSPSAEKDLVDSLRQKKKELSELEGKVAEQKALSVNLDDTDAAIDELFKRADEEHAMVVQFSNEATEFHEKFVVAVKETRQTAAEADSKHKEFIALRVKADEYHNKGMELREKVMAVKGERRAEFNERRAEIRGVNDRARGAVNDPKALEKARDSALDLLKKGGKISL